MTRLLLSLALFSFLVGCGGAAGTAPDSPEGPEPTVTTEEGFKERLTMISEVGGMGSAFAGIVEMAEENGDPELIKDAKALTQVQNPDQAKKIAKRMLEKLDK